MNKNILVCLCSMVFAGSNLLAQSDHVLWYNQPATYFEESLVLGNGKMGATVFGGVQSDKIYLNDATLWTGEPVNANMCPDAYKNKWQADCTTIHGRIEPTGCFRRKPGNRDIQGCF